MKRWPWLPLLRRSVSVVARVLAGWDGLPRYVPAAGLTSDASSQEMAAWRNVDEAGRCPIQTAAADDRKWRKGRQSVGRLSVAGRATIDGPETTGKPFLLFLFVFVRMLSAVSGGGVNVLLASKTSTYWAGWVSTDVSTGLPTSAAPCCPTAHRWRGIGLCLYRFDRITVRFFTFQFFCLFYLSFFLFLFKLLLISGSFSIFMSHVYSCTFISVFFWFRSYLKN